MDSSDPRNEGPERPRATSGSSPLPLLVVLAAVAVVTMTTDGLRVLRPAAELSAGGVWGLRVLGVVAVALGILGLLRQRARIPMRRRGPDPSVVAIRTAATIMGTLALVAFIVAPPPYRGRGPSDGAFFLPLRPSFRSHRSPGGAIPPPSFGGDPVIRGSSPTELPGLGPVSPPDQDPSPESLRSQVARILEWIIILLLGAAALFTLMRRFQGYVRQGLVFGDRLIAPADAMDSLEASLEEVVRYGPDPRAQITRAYHGLLDALAEAGAPRRPQDAPYEYLRRTLGPLGVHPEPLHRLTELYVVAQFSHRPVTEEDREAAVAALERSLAGLRAVEPLRESELLDAAPAPARA